MFYFFYFFLFFLELKYIKPWCYTLLYSRWRYAHINAGLRSAIKLKEEEEELSVRGRTFILKRCFGCSRHAKPGSAARVMISNLIMWNNQLNDQNIGVRMRWYVFRVYIRPALRLWGERTVISHLNCHLRANIWVLFTLFTHMQVKIIRLSSSTNVTVSVRYNYNTYRRQ